MTQQRLPIVNSDDGAWGDILNLYLSKEHYNTGADNTANGGHKTVTLRAGAATPAGSAPLKFTSGALLNTPEAGTIEYLSGSFYIGGATGTDGLSVAGTLRIREGGTTPTKYTIFQGGDQTADITYTLPTTAGAAGTYLQDAAGNGTLSWAKAAAVGSIVIKHVDGSQSSYQASANTDAARGTALLSAITAAVSGDAILLGPGTFDAGNVQINFPAGVVVTGIDKYMTKVKSQYSVSSMQFNDGNEIHDLTLDITVSDTNIRTITHSIASNITAKFYNVAILGGSDCIIFIGSGLSNINFYLYNCDLYSAFDAINISTVSNSSINLYNCYINTTYAYGGWTGGGGAVFQRGVAIEDAPNCSLNLYNSEIVSCSAGNPDGGDVTCAVCNGTTNNSGSILLYNTKTSVNQGIKVIGRVADFYYQDDDSVPITVVGGSGSGTNGSFTKTNSAYGGSGVNTNFMSNGVIQQGLGLPVAPTGTPSAAGGSMANGSYYYVITSIDTAGGETIQGTESAVITVSGGSNSGSVALVWTAIQGAVSYKVYRTTTSMVYATPAYIANPATNSCNDTLATPTTGAPPVVTTAYVNKINPSGDSWIRGGNLAVLGTLSAAHTTVDATMLLQSGSITDSSGAIDFSNENLSTTGTLGAGIITGTSLVKSGGTPSQFLKADGTVDSSAYLTSGANVALSNLASVAINTSLISDTDSTDDLGSSAKYWANIYTDKAYLNSTTSVDGTVAGTMKVNGGICSVGTTGAVPVTGFGTRFMWIPSRGALRAGVTYGTEWDDANIGDNSFAFGDGVVASAGGSVAMGATCTASGYGAVAFVHATASGTNSVAIGSNAASSSAASVSIGTGAKATGESSLAIGTCPKASAYGGVAIGMNENGDATSFLAGNGTADSYTGSVAIGYASSGKTVKAERTGSVVIGQDVNATGANNIIVMGKGLSVTTASSFNVGFGTGITTPDFQVLSGQAVVNGNLKINSTQTTVNGSTSGTAIFSQPIAGVAYKKVVIYLTTLVGTASYTFPTAFTKTPVILTTSGLAAAIVTTLNTTTAIVTGTTTTGFLFIEGY